MCSIPAVSGFEAGAANGAELGKPTAVGRLNMAARIRHGPKTPDSTWRSIKPLAERGDACTLSHTLMELSSQDQTHQLRAHAI